MTGLTLTLKHALPADADFAALTLPGWEIEDAATLARRTVRVGREAVPAGDLFVITGTAGDTLALHGDLTRAHGVAAALEHGTVHVHGDVGNDVGVSMRGGLIRVHGNAAHNLGGAAPGAKRGMSGGEIAVMGNAGHEAGAAMRRGVIAISGSAGARTARAALAGTVYIAGDCGPDAGLHLKRASILVGGHVSLPGGFAYACSYDPAWVRLLQRRLVQLHVPLPAEQLQGTWARHTGDAGDGALGELLLWTS